MANNKIGIKVDVEFPTVRELQADLAEKWKSVKNSFEAKINLGIDGNSLRSLKKNIRTALSEEVFDLKLDIDVKDAINSINKVHREIDKIDSSLKKQRDLKIDFKIADLDKSFRDVLEASKKTESSIKNQQGSIKDANSQLDKTVSKYEKLQQINKYLADGTISKTVKTTYVDDNKNKVTDTYKNGNLDSTNVTDNRKDSLKEIQDLMKKIHQLELKSIDADEDSQRQLQKEVGYEKELLGILRQQYAQKYKMFASQDDGVKELQRQQQVAKYLKEQSQELKKIKSEEQEIAQAVSKVAQIESKIQSINKQMVSAKDDEKNVLMEIYASHRNAQEAIRQKYNLEEKMTSEQKEQLENVKRIGSLQTQIAMAKKQETQREKEIANAQKELLSSLKQIHKLKQQIAQIESKDTKSHSDHERLAVLKEEYKVAQQMNQAMSRRYDEEGLITQEVKGQLEAQNQIHRQEMQRVSTISKIHNEQAQLNSKIDEYKAVTKEIGQLQRDLIFAGLREQNVIEGQISDLEKKRNEIKQSLMSQNQLTQAVQNEVQAIEQAQKEQRELNRLRQQARDLDQSFNTNVAGGVIDPYSFYANFEQGARSVVDSVAELDEALTGVMKVADATDEQFKEFGETSYDVASKLGVSASEYILAVEKWVTAGKTLGEAQTLANQSLVGAFVGGIQADDMVKYLSVPLTSYADQMLDANDIINIMNETANNHAIEMDELGKAYVRSAVTAKDTGASFSQLTGMITGAQEATRKGGERIGTGLKTIALNMTNINAQMTAGEKRKFDFFDSIGVDFRDANGQMLGMYDIIGNLVGKWDELSQSEQGTAKYYLAGKEHAETLGGIINQWDRIGEVVADANSEMGKGEEGSAYIEHAKQADSVKFKLAELKNAWDEMLLAVGGGTGGVADFLGALTEGLEVATSLLTNDKFMDAVKYLFAGLAIHAGGNLFKRFFINMKAGLGSTARQLRDIQVLSDQLFGRKGTMSNPNASAVLNGGNNRNSKTASNGTVLRTSGGSYKSGTSTSNRDTSDSRNSGTVIRTSSGSNRRSSTKSSNNDNDSNRSKNSSNANNNIPDANRVESTNSSLKTTGKLLKNVAGLLPLVGDAMILLEIMGVPVFDTIGKGLDNMVTSAKEFQDELEQSNKKFLATNQIMNGNTLKHDKELEGTVNKEGKREGGIVQAYEEGKKSDEYLSEEEFAALKERLENLADDANIELKLKYNNSDEIDKAIETLQKELSGIKEGEMDKFEKQYSKQIDLVLEKNKEIAEDKSLQEHYQTIIEDNQSIVDSFEERIKKGEKLTTSELQIYGTAKGNIEGARENYARLADDISASEGVIKTANKSMSEYTQNLIDYVSAGGDISDMSQETVINAIDPMIKKQNELNQQINDGKTAQDNLNNSYQYTEDEWLNLQKIYPALAGISADEINKNEEKRKKAMEVIGATNDEKQAKKEAVESAISGLARQGGFEDDITTKTNGNILAMGNLKTAIKGKNDEIDKSKKEVTLTWKIKLWESVKGLWDKIKSGFSNSESTHTVNVKENKSESVSTISGGNSSTSASVATGSDLLNSETGASSVDMATSSVNNSKVSSDVWRYWSREKYGIDNVENQISSIDNELKLANENYAKMIPLYQKQQSLLRTQISNYKSLYSAKDVEMNETLAGLKNLGFKVDTNSNKVTNLEYSKSLSGDKAESAETLLNTWSSLYSEMSSIQRTIESLNIEIKDLDDSIKDAKISQELEKFTSRLKTIDKLMTSISNKDSMFSTTLGFVEDVDKELAILTNSQALQNSQANMSTLIKQFNELSKQTVSYEENGTELLGTLEDISSEILNQADSIIDYVEAINNLELDRVIADFDEFGNAIDVNNDRIANNIDNLSEGLLSGTGIGDLMSSNTSSLSLSRNNAFTKLADERISLEEQVQKALDAYAQKNVERATNVANSQLQITASMYNQMLTMQDNYSSGSNSSVSSIVASLDSITSNLLADDGDYNLTADLYKAVSGVIDKQAKLTSEYAKAIEKAIGTDAQDSLTNAYIIDNFKLQEEYLRAYIQGAQLAIKELEKQMEDMSLTDEQSNSIKEQIATYEDTIIDAQTNIKGAIADRFDYEFKMLDEALDKYDEFNDELNYALEILEAIGGNNNETYGVLLQEMLDVEKSRNAYLQGTMSSLKEQLSMYQEGSYEWKIINGQIKEYKGMLQESNQELVDMNKNLLNNSFTKTYQSIEKVLFDGGTLKAYQEYQELWMDSIEREIALEDAYKRMADLGTSMYHEKMALLDKQEKLSRYEMDYINSQLDILELQNKLENMSKEKTVQTLVKKANGTWDWEYTSDTNSMNSVKEELAQAQLSLQELEQKGREDYLSKLDSILSDAQDGQYNSVQEFVNAIDDLGDAYSSVVGDIPQISDAYIKELIDSYSHYIVQQGSILDNLSLDTSIKNSVYEGFSEEVVRAFDNIGEKMAETFANTLMSKIPAFSAGSASVSTASSDKTISINIDNLEFPNIKEAEGIKDAILDLPSIALQKSKGK